MNTEERSIQLVNELLDGIDAGDFGDGDIISKKYRYEHLEALQMMAPYLDGGTKLYTQMYDIVIQKAIERVKAKISSGRKVNICILVISAAEWSADGLYHRFREDENIDCKIVVSPLIDRDKEGTLDSYIQTYNFFKSKGYDVIGGYDLDKDQIVSFADVINEIDVVIHLTPWYPSLPESYRITSYPLSVLNCHIRYGISLADSLDGLYKQKFIYNKEFVNFQWRVYADSIKNLNGYKKYGMLQGKNVCYSGYAKMDTFYSHREYTENELKQLWKIPDGKSVKEMKKIVIAPHHAIKGYAGILFSTFPFNAHFLYYIAEKYQDKITFLLKPHPSLRVRAVEAKVFESYEAYDEYIKKWESLPNARVIQDGDYLDIFKTSDGMIMDSGSFLGEYLYVNKPLLFLQRQGQAFNELGKEVIGSYYKVKGTDYRGIEKFLDEVVLEGKDVMEDIRRQVYEKELDYYSINGSLACDTIYNDIVSALF